MTPQRDRLTLRYGRTGLIALALPCLLIVPFSQSSLIDIVLALFALLAFAIVLINKKYNLLWLVLIVTAAPVIPIEKWLEPAVVNKATAQTYRTLDAELDIAETTIQQFFFDNASALDSISVLVGLSTALNNDVYQRWLTRILPAERNQFLDIAISKDLIIQAVYPQSPENLAIVGRYLGNVPEQGEFYQKVAKTRQPMVIGPVMLLQGVPGIIYVRPVQDQSGRILHGVLSLEFLRKELDLLLSEPIKLTVDIETAITRYRLLEDNPNNETSSIRREIKYDDIGVLISASTADMETTISRTKYLTRGIAVGLWLIIASILNKQSVSFRLREKQRRALEQSESELITAQKIGLMGSWWSRNLTTLTLSQPLQELLRRPTDHLTTEEFLSLLHPSDYKQVEQHLSGLIKGAKVSTAIEHRIQLTGSNYRWYEHRIVRNEEKGYTGILRDIHGLRERDEQVAQLESFDALTGAANRPHFKQLTSQNIELCNRQKSELALIVVGIDQFRALNENHGQHAGDLILKHVCQRLKSHAQHSDTIARLSGDTFAIALFDSGNSTESVLAIEELLRKLKEPYLLDEEVFPQFSMGIAMYPEDASDYDNLLKLAESALGSTKLNARGYYRFYSSKMSEEAERRQKILSRIPLAIRENQFNLVFQPRVSGTGKHEMVSMEALIRWQDPELGNVSPGEFIPIAEETSLIADIGLWVMNETFRIIAEYLPKLPNDISVSINLSPRQLEDPGLVENVSQALEKHNVDAAIFELEITEHSISEQSEDVLQNMHQLSGLGFRFAMDDFGTGYSNLGILQSLPLNILKVDMSFIRAIGTSEKSNELVRAILNMGHTLGLSVVAEGVETATQVKFLTALGCNELQGYYFFKPMPIELLVKVTMN